MPRSLAIIGSLVVVTMATVLGAGTAVSLHTGDTIQRLRELAADADSVTDMGDALSIALLDAESNARGYIMTRRPPFLVPFAAAQTNVLKRLSDLGVAIQHFPELTPDLTLLRELADKRLAQLGRAIDIIGAGSEPAIQAMLLSDTGRSTMQDLRTVIARMVQSAADERDRRSMEERDREQALREALMSGGVIGVLLLGTASLALLVGRDRLLRAQSAQRAQSALWQATVQNLQDGVAVFDAKDRLVQWNASLAPLTGFSPAMLWAGVPFFHFVHAASQWDPPLLSGPPPEPASTPRAQPKAAVTEVQVAERVLEVLRNAMPGGGQMLTVRDISRRVAAEAIARQAQKMDALGQLTGGVAHDFNNLLQVVSANLELLTERLASEGPAADWLRGRLGAAMEGVSRGARLTRHLLAFARRQPLAPAAIDAIRLLSGLEDMLRRTLGPAIALEQSVATGLWPLQADAQQMENALLNLAINARDAMADQRPGLARLTIEARNAILDDAYCAANADVGPGEYVMVAVSDSGCGMTAAEIVQAIEPFYTTKPEGHGTGLGLSMVYGFAKQSGGHLKLYSEPGHGTTVRLYIPRSLEAALDHERMPGASPAGDGELVLLVEDDAAVRSTAAIALRNLGYAVEEAMNADSAMTMLEQGLRPALLFTDVMMPGALSARGMAERAQALIPGLAVVFTSGYTENSIVHNGRLNPDVDLISKPWRVDELAIRLRHALDRARLGAPPSLRAGLRILLVEDEALVRMVTADMLAALNHTVVEAANAEDALRHVADVDVMITDYGLGAIDGLMLANTVRSRRPDLAIIVASGQAAPETGADGLYWLNKPYDNAALQAALSGVLPPA